MLMIYSPLSAQEDSLSVKNPDKKYREDQFYVGVTYNLLTNVPDAVNLSGVSGGIQLGFLRDMPINEERNMAIALGVGFAFDRFGQTLFIGEDTQENTIFKPLESDIDYSSNRFSTAALELPLEFRWRTSTPTQYKFWRIYAGARLSYTYWYRAYLSQPNNNVSQTDIPEFEPLRVAATLSLGYSTFNFYVNYSITPFFNGAFAEGTQEEIGFNPLKVGIIFYIL